MRLHLRRFADFGDGGTLGRLAMGQWEAWAMEAPWRDNKRFVSCIPGGLYRLQEHHGDKYSGTFALVNHDLGVSHWEDPDCARYACVLHPARFARHLSGCISFGLSLALEGGVPMLGARGAAHSHVLNAIGIEDQHEFLIEDRPGGWET